MMKKMQEPQEITFYCDMQFTGMMNYSEMICVTAACTVLWTEVHSTSDTLSFESIHHFHCMSIRDLIKIIS